MKTADYTNPGRSPFRGWPDAIVPMLVLMSVDPAFARFVALQRAKDIKAGRALDPSSQGGRFVIFRDRIIAISGPVDGNRLDAHPALMGWTQSGRHVITAGLDRSKWRDDWTEIGTYYVDADLKTIVGFPDACTRVKADQYGNPTVMRIGSRAGPEPKERFEPSEAPSPITPLSALPAPLMPTVAPAPTTLDGEPAAQSRRIPAMIGTPAGFVWATSIDQLRPLAAPAISQPVPVPSSLALVALGFAKIMARRLRADPKPDS